jgi:hypothetical protein
MSDFDIQNDYPYLAAQASKSCPFQCSFCNVASFFRKYQEKDTTQTIAEMTNLTQKYGLQLFFMNDALLNTVATTLANGILKADFPGYWDGYLRVDKSVCDIENTMLWRRGGFYRARMGVESGSQHVLDMMGKKITPAQIKTSLGNLANAGIKTTTYWVIGHPGENEEDFRQTLALLEELKDSIYEAECNPFIYSFGGQGKSGQWQDNRVLLYPQEADDMLVIRTWIVDSEPGREETYRRICRFVEHCDKLGIPNPYSFRDIYEADKRWKRLHKNAVPPVIDFREKKILTDERKNVKKLFLLKSTPSDEGDFDF